MLSYCNSQTLPRTTITGQHAVTQNRTKVVINTEQTYWQYQYQYI